jgi:methionyl aminopeptidase
MRTGRNDFCPCGSGLKYKKCCLKKEQSDSEDQKSLYFKKFGIKIKTDRDIEGMRLAGKLAVETLELVRGYIKPGIKTDEINNIVHEFTIKNGAIPAPLNYRGYPKSVCISINEVICHGIPGERRLTDGDIVNIDVTPILNGYYADANMTFLVGNVSPDARKIVNVARESLRAGMSMIKPGNAIGDIGWAIQQYAEGEGCSVVRDFVGHGVGLDFMRRPRYPTMEEKGRGLS